MGEVWSDGESPMRAPPFHTDSPCPRRSRASVEKPRAASSSASSATSRRSREKAWRRRTAGADEPAGEGFHVATSFTPSLDGKETSNGSCGRGTSGIGAGFFLDFFFFVAASAGREAPTVRTARVASAARVVTKGERTITLAPMVRPRKPNLAPEGAVISPT